MATYVMLFRFTEKGVQNIKDSPTRVEQAKELFRSLGAQVKEFYALWGSTIRSSLWRRPMMRRSSRLLSPSVRWAMCARRPFAPLRKMSSARWSPPYPERRLVKWLEISHVPPPWAPHTAQGANGDSTFCHPRGSGDPCPFVIPVRAGTQRRSWVPAFAGTTKVFAHIILVRTGIQPYCHPRGSGDP